MITFVAIVARLASAEVPLPSYPEELARERWGEVNAMLEEGCAINTFPVVCREGATERAAAHADTFQDTVVRDAGLEYLAALANRYGGNESVAIRRYEAAILLDPKRAEAWYDLGEIWMARGDFDDAQRAFEQVRTLKSDGELAWIGPWRLAEVSALLHDPVGLERNIKDALHHGFSFRQVMGQANWRSFYADPALTDTLDKLLTVYADPEVRASLQPEPAR